MDEYSKKSKETGESVGAVEKKFVSFDSPFELVSKAVLPRWEMCYETYGKPNHDLSNAVLVCHALSGSQHAAGWYADNPNNIGWWDNFIGPNKPLDTNRYYVISPNNLGGCHGSTGPTSLHPDDQQPYGSRFPVVTVEDWVNSQNVLAQHLGIERFVAVVGGSLGGMQALRWAISYPDQLSLAVIIAASPRLSATNIAFNDIARRAIMTDNKFHNGNYYQYGEIPADGLGVARMLGHVTYLSEALMAKKFGRIRHGHSQHYGYDIEFEIESYLRYQGEKFSKHFDANTYLLMTKALDYFDPGQDANGNLARALESVQARCLLLAFSSDLRFPPFHSQEILRALLAANKDVSYLEIESDQGHDSFLLTDPIYHQTVAAFMNHWHDEHLK